MTGFVKPEIGSPATLANVWHPSPLGTPVGSGEQSTIVTAMLKGEQVPGVVPVWPAPHKPEDSAAMFITAAFIHGEDDEDMTMAKHLQDFPKPGQLASKKPAADSKISRMTKPSQMSIRRTPLTQKYIGKVCTSLKDLGEKVPDAINCMKGGVLMLMDSGAVRNVACRDKQFPASTAEESEAQRAGAAYQTAI